MNWNGTRLAAWIILSGFVLQAPAQIQRIDESTGRDLAHWPPPRHFDVIHQRVALDIPRGALDTRPEALLASTAIAATALGTQRTHLRLHAERIRILSVTIGRRSARHSHSGSALVIELPRPAEAGETIQIAIDYEILDFEPDGLGLSYMPPSEEESSPTEAHAAIFSQGQSEFNRRWMPSHDFPNDRCSTEVVVTVERPFDVISNGTLVSQADLGDGRTRWHWSQSQPHPIYLVSLVIGVFERLELPTHAREDGTSVPLAVYTRHGSAESVRHAFGRTTEMLEFFTELFDEPYPWDRYDQVIVRGFPYGGMENTAASTFHPDSAWMSREELEDLIAHELGHQWFGNLVTCKSWEHLWLNEGWATMCEALWAERAAELAGEDPVAAYQAVMLANASVQRAAASLAAPMNAPMVSNLYPDDDFLFSKPDNVYSKGALVLHMLRMRLGDDAFFEAARVFLDRHRFGEVETDEFRRVLEDVSGQSLRQFFEQWCYRPGLPSLEIELAWDPDELTLAVSVRQVQVIDEYNPPYALELPVEIEKADGTVTAQVLSLDSGEEVFVLPSESEPVDFVVDPSMTVFAIYRITRPLAHAARGTDQ